MVGSRTIKMLTALAVAMTLGAILLAGMQREPINLLAAVESADQVCARAVYDTEGDFKADKWQNLIVDAHDQPDRAGAMYHFVIRMDEAGARVEATDLWRRQASGKHTFTPAYDWNAESIGVCLVGRFTADAPPTQQVDALCRLVRVLQELFNISAESVYLRRDLASIDSLGPGFPAKTFQDALIELQ